MLFKEYFVSIVAQKWARYANVFYAIVIKVHMILFFSRNYM